MQQAQASAPKKGWLIRFGQLVSCCFQLPACFPSSNLRRRRFSPAATQNSTLPALRAACSTAMDSSERPADPMHLDHHSSYQSRSRSRSRSYSRQSRSPSMDRRHSDDRNGSPARNGGYRSRSRSRGRTMSRTPSRTPSRDRSYSRSPSRSRNESPQPKSTKASQSPGSVETESVV